MHSQDDFLLRFVADLKKDIEEMGLDPELLVVSIYVKRGGRIYSWRELPRVYWIYSNVPDGIPLYNTRSSAFMHVEGTALLRGINWTDTYNRIMRGICFEERRTRLGVERWLEADSMAKVPEPW